MNQTNEQNKGKEFVSGLWKKTAEIGQRTASGVAKGAKSLSEKAKEANYRHLMEKYNPLFPNQYASEDFKLPNMVVISTDAERRNIEVCSGAIGWRSTDGEMEILHLYDDFIPESKLQFIPNATCDSIYYVDPFDRQRFIRIDCIFSKAHEERLAELKHIANALGAKSCSIEIAEASREITESKKASSMKLVAESISTSDNASCEDSTQRSGRITAQFEGNDTPKKPKLKWFANDENIKNLIEMRCKKGNQVKSETLELAGSSSAVLSQKTAYTIDSVVNKMKISGKSSMETQAKRENSSKLIFCVEF